MVSALYASQIAGELVSIQPLDSPIGQIIFLQYLYGDTRGDNTTGQAMINEFGAMQNGDQRNRYACQVIAGIERVFQKGRYAGRNGVSAVAAAAGIQDQLRSRLVEEHAVFFAPLPYCFHITISQTKFLPERLG